jgi:hypothetical protein
MAAFTAAGSSRANDRLQSFKLAQPLRLSVAHPKARLQLLTSPGLGVTAGAPVAGRPGLPEGRAAFAAGSAHATPRQGRGAALAAGVIQSKMPRLVVITTKVGLCRDKHHKTALVRNNLI